MADSMIYKFLPMITLWEPWASLVIGGAKPFEFRGRRTPMTIVNKRCGIHAAKWAVDMVEVEMMLRLISRRDEFPEDAAELCLDLDKAKPILEAAMRRETLYGVILGTAIVGEAQNGGTIAHAHFGAASVNVGSLDANFGWPLTEIERWPEPVPARGGQGIWYWHTERMA